MTHGSLFSGIGGGDLAANWMGWQNIFQCEIDKFCQKVLTKNFPDTIKYYDITTTDFTIHRGKIDILTGGFPCQTFSVAGKGATDLTLWKEMYRAIKEIQPTFVVAENVPGIVGRKGAMAFEVVCSDLENEGYEVQPFNIPIASVGAPHKRERIWFVAYSDKFRRINEQKENREVIHNKERNSKTSEQIGRQQQCRACESNTNTSDTNSVRLQRKFKSNGIEGKEFQHESHRRFGGAWQENWYEVATLFCRVDDGIPNRVDRLKSLGNAYSPDVILEIFKAIEKMFKTFLTR